jgi:8-oxo-dGTP diphosphatase
LTAARAHAFRDTGHVGDRAMDAAPESSAQPARVPCVGAVIQDDAGRILLIKRGHEPGKGLWSVPGGRIEPGETDEQAIVREVWEETGLEVSCGPLLGAIERPGMGGTILQISDYHAVVTGGELAAGDDAADARWLTLEEASELDSAGRLTGGLLAILRSWGALG